jgi:hypothetical protein
MQINSNEGETKTRWASQVVGDIMYVTEDGKSGHKYKKFWNGHRISGVPRNFFRWGGSTNSVEDRGQREWGSGGGSPLVRGSGAAVIWYKKFHFVQ